MGNRVNFFLDYSPLTLTYCRLMRMVFPSSFLFCPEQIKFQLSNAIQGDYTVAQIIEAFDDFSLEGNPQDFIRVTERMETVIYDFFRNKTGFFPYHFSFQWLFHINPSTLELTYGNHY